MLKYPTVNVLWWCYDLLVCVVALCYLPVYAVQGKLHRGLGMRLGCYPASVMSRLDGRPLLWIHAVSVGEALAARPFVEALRARYPTYQLLVSTVTATGQQVAARWLTDRDLLCYWPLDVGAVWRRAMDRCQPRALIVLESELWPNALRWCAARGVPVVLINGRISERSFRRYRRVRPLARWIVRQPQLALMQTDEDARRLRALGAEPSRVRVTGNLKFDGATLADDEADASALRRTLGLADDAWLVIGGSTHPGEERVLLDAYEHLRRDWTRVRLLLAPRHVERAAAVESLMRAAGHAVVRCSQGAASPAASSGAGGPPVLLVDTIGQLRHLYRLATIVVMGGSFIKHGGQNPLEAAAVGKAVIVGPHMENFREIVEQLVHAQAAVQVRDGQALLATCRLWLRQPKQREAVGQRARALVERQTGATQRTLDALGSVLLH